MPNRFSPGQRVMIMRDLTGTVRETSLEYNSMRGMAATVQDPAYSGGSTWLQVVWDKQDHGFPATGGWHTDVFVLLAPPFNPKKPVQQRCGRPAKLLTKTLPYRAEIQMPNGNFRVFHYSEHGYFYKNIESDIDLVNA